ncbi:AraC family transcriptional regulator [Marinobacterium marinum]|uniref:AraC family transcriptional regulator n=1 Tax=Marinobacterium marinum TaxID=2756129 RepID=A0A7W1WW95_9GAMM|nr:AraC family transcriptional regulator [Marinobacterium marinum]MBA4501323.1 AraC family transcriptional regulator [Marinobacterium marinum]
MITTDLPRPSCKAHIANHYIRASIEGALRQGAEPGVLLKAAGIPPTWLDTPEHLISEHQLSELIKAVWRHTRDEFMGLSPTPCRRGVFSLMAELAQGASTLGGMLQQSARFYTAWSDDLNIGLEATPHTQTSLVFYRLHLNHQGKDRHHLLQEFILLMWQRLASWLVGQQIPIASTCFGYPPPPHAREYRAMFLGELLYEQPLCGFYLHPRYLQLPVIRSTTELQAFLQNSPAMILHRPVPDNSLQTRIRVLLQRHDLDQMPELDTISQLLAIAPRTLRRRLQDEGTTIREIKERLRRDFALKLLASEHVSVQEVAEQTGFAEAAAFCRAFKRWTGYSPTRWRRHIKTLGRQTQAGNPNGLP